MTSLTDLPIGRVVRLYGPDPEALRLAAAQLPASGLAVLTCDVVAVGSMAEIVSAVLDELVSIAVDLLPRWLPDAVTGPAAARTAATQLAASSEHFGPYLTDLAAYATAPQTIRPPQRFPMEIQAAGLARVLADTFEQRPIGLLLTGPADLDEAAGVRLVAAAEWLAQRAGLGVWLAGPVLSTADRIAAVRIDLPADLDALVEQESRSDPAVRVRYPPLAGVPCPGSAAEQRLETALSSRPWATGRIWNQGYRLSPPGGLIRPDLHWPEEHCVVEVDGPEHRGPLQYAADRRRDVLLQLDKRAVLRFTNAQVLYDLDTVLCQIERYLQCRRTSFSGETAACLTTN